ncbi:MAG: ABC transporter ATP-binding protein [Caldilineaceae bacterium]
MVVGFLEYVRRFFPRAADPWLWVLVQSSLAGAERIFHLLDEEVTLSDAPNARTIPEIQGRIVFDNVHFEYDEGEPILRGVSLTARPGQTIAVVSPTGAGKTTVINLLSRFYDVTDGRAHRRYRQCAT